MTKQEFDAKIGAVSSELLYARAEHVYMESDLFIHQRQLVDFFHIFGERGVNELYFTVCHAQNWSIECAKRQARAA